jgi:hypothetical protein
MNDNFVKNPNEPMKMKGREGTGQEVSQDYDPNSNRSFNQLTSNTYDVCEYENSLRVGSKPMKYFVNQLNTPQSNPFIEFTSIGNKKVYNVENEYQRPLPTRLNTLPQSYVLPYSTTPNLGQSAPSMMYSDTESNLRFGSDLRPKKSSVALGEIDYNQWSPAVEGQTVQNAGQFNNNMGMGALQSNAQGIDRDGFFNYKESNNVLFANSAFPYFGISSRNQLHNASETSGC